MTWLLRTTKQMDLWSCFTLQFCDRLCRSVLFPPASSTFTWFHKILFVVWRSLSVYPFLFSFDANIFSSLFFVVRSGQIFAFILEPRIQQSKFIMTSACNDCHSASSQTSIDGLYWYNLGFLKGYIWMPKTPCQSRLQWNIQKQDDWKSKRDQKLKRIAFMHSWPPMTIQFIEWEPSICIVIKRHTSQRQKQRKHHVNRCVIKVIVLCKNAKRYTFTSNLPVDFKISTLSNWYILSRIDYLLDQSATRLQFPRFS